VEFYERVSAAAGRVTENFEIVLVNDGSPDDSQRIALELCRRDPRVRLIELSRNFGHYKAIMTGLAEADGAHVFLVDSDLEEPPEILGDFHAQMRETGVDVVYGVQDARKGGRFERASGAAFYWLFNLLSTHSIPRNLVTARLMTRSYVQALVQHRDREVFLGGLLAITGFEQASMKIAKGSRRDSSYSLVHRIGVVINAITSFSVRPLLFIFALGWIIMALSALTGGYLIVRQLFFGRLLAGFPALMVSIWFLGGLTTFALGIVGIYLSKIFAEVKDRPYTVVRARYGHAVGELEEMRSIRMP
jgi:putative glycosyltransferase